MVSIECVKQVSRLGFCDTDWRMIRGDESVPAAAAGSSDQLRTDPEIENNKIITLNQLILISHQRDQLSQSIKIVTLIKIKSDRTWSLW